jgi:hypothetical protein
MFKPNNYEQAMVGQYTKFSEGQNRFRFLTEPITGYVYWVNKEGSIVPKNSMAGEGGKPVRAPDFTDFPLNARSAMKGFAAAVVWNYDAQKIQILEIKQVVIMNALEALASSKSWGDITSFDVIITKTKTGPEARDVEYSVMPEPKSELDETIMQAYEQTPVNLEALYSGDDPFGESVDVDEIDN